MNNRVGPRSLINLSARALLLLAPGAYLTAQQSAPAVKLSPSTAQVRLLGAETFNRSSVTVTSSLVWQLVSTAPNSKPESTGALGTIDSNGNYQAPVTMPARQYAQCAVCRYGERHPPRFSHGKVAQPRP